jgi:hypothetical protein
MVAMANMESENYFRFPFYTGFLVAHLTNADAKKYLKDRGITDKQIQNAYDALLKLTPAFYREAGDHGRGTTEG